MKITEYLRNLSHTQTVRLLTAISFPWVVLVVSPLTLFFGNRKEYFGLWDVVFGSLFAFILVSTVVLPDTQYGQ